MADLNRYRTPSADEIAAGFDTQASQAQAEAVASTPTVEPSIMIPQARRVQGVIVPNGWSVSEAATKARPSTDKPILLNEKGEVAQVPFDPADDQTPGFFGAIKDAYNRSSLKGGNAFNYPNIFESLSQGVFHRTAEEPPKPNDKPKGLLGKLADDAVAIGAGLPIALSHPLDTAAATFYGGTDEDDVATRLKKGAVVESVGQVFDKQYYKDHPGLAVLNTGSWIATIFSFGLSKALGSAVKVGVARGVEEAAATGAASAAVNVADDIARSAATRSAAEVALKVSTKNGSLRTAVTQAFKTGDASIVSEVAKNSLIKQGLTEEVATRIASSIKDAVAENLAKNSTKLNVLKTGAHPFTALSDAAGGLIDPLKKLVFGDTPNSAVGKIYGAETVAKDPQGFVDIERWAGQQVEEKGLKNTVANREAVMNDWSRTVSEWSVLTPEERVAYHQNYVRASEMAKQVSKITGDMVVPTKFMPPSYVAAIKATILEADAALSPVGILDELQSIYGSDIKIHRKSLDKLIAADPTREALAAGIEALGNRETLSYNNLPEVNNIIKDLEATTGYRLVEAPTGKPISFATAGDDVAKAAASGADAIPEASALTKAKTKLGQLVDRLGLSPTGGNEGSIEYLFQDNFNQGAVESMTSKYGNTFRVRNQTVPFAKLYDFLEAKRSDIFERASIKGKVFNNATGVIDMTVDDLVTYGFKKPMAEDIVALAKNALTDIPFEKTGLADGIANFMKAKVPGYGKFMKVAMDGRFNLNPFYGAQAWIEMEFNKATALGDVKGALKSLTFGERTDNLVASVLEKIPYLRDAINPELNFTDIKLVSDELLGDLQQNTLSAVSNPEMATLRRAAGGLGSSPAEMQAFAKSIQSNNATFRALGYTTQRAATGFAKVFAEKLGFTLEEALSSRIVNGRKVYNNPEAFNMLREATADLAGYKPGFLTSPLAKTMNVVWFPFRFQAKTIAGVANFMGKLPPLARIGVMSDWNHFSNWAISKEGIKWRQENSHTMYNVLNYVFAWESGGRAIGDVLDGKLFGGNMGQLGGMPFGFITNLLENLGIKADQPQGDSKGYSKQVPKKLMSNATAVTFIETLVSHVFPKMPFYTLFNGNVSSPETFLKKTVIEGVYANVLDKATGGNGVGAKAKFQRQQFKTLRPGKNRFQ